jgi:preprotein translocase subunit SecE
MNGLESIKQPIVRSREFLEECWAELRKVNWPTREETRAATLAVIVGVVIVAAFLGLVDLGLYYLLNWVLAG